MHASHNVSPRRHRLATHHLLVHHGFPNVLSHPRLSFFGFFFSDSGDVRSAGESSTRSVSLLSRVAGMKAGGGGVCALTVASQKDLGGACRLSDCHVGVCLYLPTPPGLISSACLQRERPPPGANNHAGYNIITVMLAALK